ncbi:MAG: phospho-N-acetylmuramoyl-pentapeptide-transferase [Candidatus Gorgyraea atricola]|nr:phospho-N-acetylmuramoyl-pentapeptide-transferase [Candidatus Gorgyraea atricola]
MLYYLLYSLKEHFSVFNVFRYITFRAALASVTAFLITIIFAPPIIRKLQALKIGEIVRKKECPDLYNLHKDKQGTPTMGGILILLGIGLSTILWADVKNSFVLLALMVTGWLGGIGFLDDYKKLKPSSRPGLNLAYRGSVPIKRGLTKRTKLFAQILAGFIVGLFLYVNPKTTTMLEMPFFKALTIDLGIFYIPFVILVITSASNAVNLTDGLDGLAIGCIALTAVAYAGMSYVTGHIDFANYLGIYYLPEAGELTVFCAAILGAGLGFLWYNSHPASIFMGDTGALALGGAIGTVAVFVKKEMLLLLVGGIFVIEALSVLLQIISFRSTGKRIFKIAPLHHHFEMCGWAESKVTVRFWIIAIILVLLSFATLKLR